MTGKPKPSKAPTAWRGKPGYERYGEMKPPVYPERRTGLGAWLVGMLTAWKR